MKTTTTPDIEAEAATARLALLGSNIEAYRAERGLSYAELRRACDGLTGSDRQFSRIRAGETTGVDLDEWLPRYESAWGLLEARADEATGEPSYDDLSLPRALRGAVAGVLRETGLQRCVIVTAPSGMGKSTAARLVRAKLAGRAVEAVADPSWSKPSAFLAGLAMALGHREPPTGEAALLGCVVGQLCAGRKMLMIDEAHHLSGRTLNYLIALINRTPGEFILFSIPTLWRKLEQASWEECRQLTRNRLHERIVLTRLAEADAARVIARRLGASEGEAKQLAKVYCAGGEERNLSLLVAVCRECVKQREGQAGPVVASEFIEVLTSVGGRR
jgi:DNA transposition AAA+ family ATPase